MKTDDKYTFVCDKFDMKTYKLYIFLPDGIQNPPYRFFVGKYQYGGIDAVVLERLLDIGL